MASRTNRAVSPFDASPGAPASMQMLPLKACHVDIRQFPSLCEEVPCWPSVMKEYGKLSL